MSDDDKYSAQVTVVKQECKEADEAEIIEEFRRYEEEFLIPPEDALRSVIRKFQAASGQEQSTTFAQPARVEKKVDRFADLGSDDKNVTLEVSVVTYTPRIQMVRGEEKQIAFGWIEDNPWEPSDKRERWDFKDWGDHGANLAPSSIVRLEGVSVNEWNDKRSININRSSRVTILREGGPAVPAISDEPVTIEKASENEGFVNVVARIIASKPDVIVKRDGSGTIDIVRGRLADSTGSIGFLSWVPIEHEVGSLVKIDSAMVKKFRETPEININDRTMIEIFHDKSFASTEVLSEPTTVKIADLRNGMRDIITTVQVESWQSRTFTNAEGEERIVRSGDVMDPTGRCRLTAWCEIEPKPGDFLHLTNARVQYWQGSPDLVIDKLDQISNLEDKPWESIDPANHWVDVELTELVSGGSRRGITTAGTIVAVRSDSGIIQRCPECRRVLREDACAEHGVQRGNEDLRLRLVLDNGVSNASLLLARAPAESYLGIDLETVKTEIAKEGPEGFVADLRKKLLARNVVINGRALVDEQGAMIMAEDMTFDSTSAEDAAKSVMEKWGVVM